MPVDVDAIGMVTPISSVALKSRLETTIVAVHFEDGAKVSEGDLLFTLDSRQIDAQIEQAEGVLAKDQAQLEGAQRDLAATTIWSPRAPPPRSTSTTPGPSPTS